MSIEIHYVYLTAKSMEIHYVYLTAKSIEIHYVYLTVKSIKIHHVYLTAKPIDIYYVYLIEKSTEIHTFCRWACSLFLASVVSRILVLKALLTALKLFHISLAHWRRVLSISPRRRSEAARSFCDLAMFSCV